MKNYQKKLAIIHHTGQCNVANCLQCVTPNVCGRCANGYDLVNGACRSESQLRSLFIAVKS